MYEDFEIGVRGSALAARRITPENHVPGSPAVVLLHEGLGCIDMWREFPLALAAATGRQVVLYDRLGYGRSDPRGGPWGVDYLTRFALDELPAVLEACRVDRPVLVGHSDGGTIALRYAADHPVRGLIAEAAHVFVESSALKGIRRTVEAWASGSLEQRLARYHGEKTRQVFRDWADTWTSPAFAGWSITEHLSRVRCPALLIQGAEDEYATPEHLQMIAGSLGGPVETVLVPGCGHSPHLQAGDRVLDECTRFIAALEA